jgi:Family of unknown function (DUF6541)
VLTPGVTTWGDVAPVLVVAMVVLFLPGVISARLTGIPWFGALGIAPLVSTTIVVAGGVVAGAAGQPWGLPTLVVSTAAVWSAQGLGLLAGRLLHGQTARARLLRGQPRIDWGSSDRLPDDQAEDVRRAGASAAEVPQFGFVQWAVLVASLVMTSLAVAVVLVRVSGSPEAFPQHPDTIFHLGDAQWMAEHRDVSILHAAGFISTSGTGAYPAAFHAMTATTALIAGVPVVVATSCFVLVAAGLAWPMGMIVLARSLFGARPNVTATAAAASVLFTAFPFMLMGFGVLWPSLFGEVLIPASLTLGAAALAPLARIPAPVARPMPAALLLGVTLVGLTGVHPNALLTLMHLGILALTGALAMTAWRLRSTGSGHSAAVWIGAAAVPLVFAIALTALRPATMVKTGAPGPELSVRSALVDTILFAPRSAAHLPALTILAAVGALAVFRLHRSAWWVPVSAGYFAVLFYLNVAVDTPVVRYLTWPWFNNAVRLAAVGVLPAALLVTAAGCLVIDLLSRMAPRWRAAQVFATVLVVGAFLGLSRGYVPVHERWLNRYFHPDSAHSWVSPGELAALHRFGGLIPPDAVTAANPWNGGTYLYVVSGRRLLVPTEKSLTKGDREFLAAHLDLAGTDPLVCAAARRQHVEYAIVGGKPFAWATGQSLAHYHGFDAVADSPAFTPVAHAGPYTLYRLTRCAAG